MLGQCSSDGLRIYRFIGATQGAPVHYGIDTLVPRGGKLFVEQEDWVPRVTLFLGVKEHHV